VGGVVAWVWVNQARMTAAMAQDFRAMAAEFRRVFGVLLLGTSGVRTDQEQEAIFRERYVPSNQVNGRKVYDYRWWRGVLWARISSAGTVAAPGTSNHQIAAGRRGAVDLRDSGNDPGVTRFGTRRNKWLQANAPRWGFNADEGRNVGEAWHYRYVRDPWRAVLPTVTPGKPTPPKPEPEPEPPEREDDSMKVFGYINPADPKRTTYVTWDQGGGLWDEFVSSDADYGRSVAVNWGDGAPMLSLKHRNALAEKFVMRWPDLADMVPELATAAQ